MTAKEIELSVLKADWLELPTPGSGYWFLHIGITGGNGKVTELWLTRHQAAEVVRVAQSRES